jgi:FtsZ-binding cell division protein ZapB
MADKEDEKKRVLTPPADWSEGLKPKASSDYDEDIDESTDWLEDDDFEVPPTSEPTAEPAIRETADNEPPSASEALLTDHSKTDSQPSSGNAKAAWAIAVIGLIAAVGMGGLWVDTRSTADVEIAELKDTVRSLKRAENQKVEPDAQLVSDYAALTAQNLNLQERYDSLVGENKSLKEREAQRAANAIQKTQISKAPEKPAAATAPPQSGGRWFVNLESHTSRSVAADRADLLRKQLKPVNVSVAQAEVSGRQYFRIRAAGFESKRDAAQASDWMSLQLSAGPYWIGKAPANPPKPQATPTPTPAVQDIKEPAATQAKTPIRLQSLPMQENWFVFVDTFDQGSRADAVIAELSSQGLDAKVAVESRSGELFYRVQVVGIGSRADGESIVTQLKDGEFKNARLKRSVN